MAGTLNYCAIYDNFTLAGAERALKSLRYQIEEGDDPDLTWNGRLQLWFKPGMFMFAVPSPDWDGYADLEKDGWVRHGNPR